LILFNSGVYEEISLSAWLGGNPGSLLTDNFGISKGQVDLLPRKSAGISGRRG
jgi:oxalate decarboxylase/phosphoglucose isomerase-like protein (cupin superfamily)